MSNSIIELLNLVDKDLDVLDQKIDGNQVFITIEKKRHMQICPICGSIMHSKGIYKRNINHPIFIDNRTVTLILNKRKYKCSSKECGYMHSDEFKFVQPGKHNSNVTPLLILNEFKSLSVTASDVANKLNVSDSYVYDTFINSYDFERLPLTDIISIDEVYMNFDYRHKYPMVILDFYSGEPIDIVKSRREEDTNEYFLNIPLSEREKVKYLICDMYNPYINYTSRYFPNAECIIDNFHVIKWINDRLNTYVRSVIKQYQERDKKNNDLLDYKSNKYVKKHKDSREVYILKHYKVFLLANVESIDYEAPARKDFKLNMYLTTQQREKMFMDLDDKFMIYRDLKELYIEFSKIQDQSRESLKVQLNQIVSTYKNSEESPFVGFAFLLEKHQEYILNSFKTIQVIKPNGKKVIRRLSNGPIESFNNKPKNLKRAAKGIKNFEYARGRLLWATRKNCSLIIKVPQNNKR